MRAYVIRRIGLGLLTLWLASVLSFVIIQLPPGDFVTTYIAELEASSKHVTQERAQALRHGYGLDRPVVVQYLRWMSHVVQGDFGQSLDWKRPVSQVIGDKLPLTIALSVTALLVAELFALPIGIWSAVRQYSRTDYLFTFIAFLGLGVPDFLLALILLYAGFLVFHVNIGGLFSAAFVDAGWSLAKVWDLIKHLPLPVFVLGLLGAGSDTRVMRANLLDEMRKPYVITARAKGLSERRLLLKYPVRVALNPFVSSIGLWFPSLLSGTIIVSLVLSLPTLGPIFLRSLQAQDMFLAGTIMLMLGTMTVVGTLISDLTLMWIDPRIRHGG